ncbi:Kinesin-like protein [Wickerhamomyces ciferrii]|uniref:Kinesin-like protein n=1 Tax=Wickerhamomyces ciferrii (strain ATCC 14091 / BCRC 22168 / CBS 111 / JCM 3599 / NBRC 0793 / NRRL Y-1031 F-60-10) TaxID=1206466 RepID=K0KLW4_WICCF|nr:Kinesin-like protein [Wickerhamomyces ciferrii]CCH42329.1 Kinesin-like protein [Wickerhamomyces ciferrii]
MAKKNQNHKNQIPELKAPAQVPSTSSSPSSPIRSNTKDQNVDKSNVKVLVRVRPKLSREIELDSQILVKMNGNNTQLHNPNPMEFSSPIKNGANIDDNNDKIFTFDHSIWSTNESDPHFKSQLDTYDLIGKEILDHTLNGYNTCIFAYGQTGSGKSFTMMGNELNPGIIPRTCNDLFQEISKMDIKIKTQVKVSYFEIYNEQVKDLLGKNDKPLRVRENPLTGPYVDQLIEFPIESYQDFQKYMDMGNGNRTTASTKMNDQSSRSHAVFTINIRTTEFNSNEELIKEKSSCLRLVDLAGSERTSSTGATGVRLKEGTQINKSLTTLGRVISALSDGQKPPYRDSILTWILKESLGGNSKTAMIACISPCDYEETLSTLRYATIAKKVKLNAKLNIDEVQTNNNEEELMNLKVEIEKLTNSLNSQKGQDELINNITNLSKFFENRLYDQTNKYELIKNKFENLNDLNFTMEKNLNTLMNSIFNDSILNNDYNEVMKKHDELIAKNQIFKKKLDDDLIKFDPISNGIIIE